MVVCPEENAFMHKRLFFLLCHIFLVLCATSSLAEETGIPGVLDYSVRRATITRNEFYLYAGDYYGDSLENSWLVGGEYMFHFTRHFGLGADFAYSKADFNENVFYSQAGFWTNDNVYIIDATGMINFPAAYRMGEKVIEADLYILLGGGTINLNSSYEPHGFIGGGMKIYLGKPWLAVRVDLKDTFHTTEKPASTEFDQDLLFTAGLSFQMPPKF